MPSQWAATHLTPASLPRGCSRSRLSGTSQVSPLVGNAYRSPLTMDKAVNAKLEGADDARAKLTAFWSSLAELVRYADVVDGSIKVPTCARLPTSPPPACSTLSLSSSTPRTHHVGDPGIGRGEGPGSGRLRPPRIGGRVEPMTSHQGHDLRRKTSSTLTPVSRREDLPVAPSGPLSD
jgi:hypothetical protein